MKKEIELRMKSISWKTEKGLIQNWKERRKIYLDHCNSIKYNTREDRKIYE